MVLRRVALMLIQLLYWLCHERFAGEVVVVDSERRVELWDGLAPTTLGVKPGQAHFVRPLRTVEAVQLMDWPVAEGRESIAVCT